MKKIACLVAAVVMMTAAEAQSIDESAVRNVLAVQTDAWNKGDIGAFMQGYWKNDSLLFVGKAGPGYGWQNTLDNYKKRYPDTATMGKLHFDLLQLKPLGKEYYFVLGQWHLTRSIGDVGGFFTLLFRKVNGVWVIIADHTS